jgi:hypothetical protein
VITIAEGFVKARKEERLYREFWIMNSASLLFAGTSFGLEKIF